MGTTNSSLCVKCKAPWRREEARLIVSETGALKRQQSTPEEDLKNIATNILINTLVHKYWSDDLKVIEMRNKANQKYTSRSYSEALELYNAAFDLTPYDHLVLGNRSITHLKSGNFKAALEDANKAVELRPDWAKGHLRRGNALKMLGRHDEAFKALFSCLVLEKNVKSQKPVKQELAKELHQLLKMSYSPIPHKEGLNCKASSSSPTSSTGSVDSLSVLDTFRTADLPACLRELGAYLDKICDQSANDNLENGEENTTNNATNAASGANVLVDVLTSFGESELTGHHIGHKTGHKNWLTVHQQIITRPFRELDLNSVIADDYECPLCMRTFWKPITTPRGHTFCKTCLDRVLDHNTNCPMCKSATLKSYLSERRDTMPSEFIEVQMKLHLPNEYSERMKIHETEMQQLSGKGESTTSGQVPIFVCTLSFPNISCPLHVFEPRYRLMIRRCMEVGTREFGMCMHVNDGKPFSDYGTMLEIRDIQFFDDGRSIVDTMGSKRFKVLNRSILDGYNTAQIEFLEDDPIPEDQIEELKKLHDETLQQAVDWFEGSATSIRSGIIANYGSLPEKEYNYWTTPNGPTWSWWLLNIIPVDPALKVQLLSSTSLKKRLENLRRILKILSKAGNRKPNN